MYRKVSMRVWSEASNLPSKHSLAERYALASSLEAIKIFGIILSHVLYTDFLITRSSSAKICRKTNKSC